eukprot:TRINITY_DN18880_c0_g1_i1.p2 TRINITY_DN18880_c0_g1~~TRINITY_DN18880_c0_g1_i1.p2  ORF type:complete len:295 (+),score=-57.30 TRINITY_DN18880_c0_g1_i1:1845-2729(+)
MQAEIESRCGKVVFIGLPNAGKSTLLNALLGKKVSIVSNKPHTTQKNFTAVKTDGAIQILYLDTPGVAMQARFLRYRTFNREALGGILGVQLIVYVAEANQSWDRQTEKLLEALVGLEEKVPVLLVFNKIDKMVKDPDGFANLVQKFLKKYPFCASLGISAKTGENVQELESAILPYIPEGKHMFSESVSVASTETFVAQELLREKLFIYLKKELPYCTRIHIDSFEETPTCIRIAANIQVIKPSQKAIIIGKAGAQLKRIATSARLDMENFFSRPVFLQCWVTVAKSQKEAVA